MTQRQTAITVFDYMPLHMFSRRTTSNLARLDFSQSVFQSTRLLAQLHTPTTSRFQSTAAMNKSPPKPLKQKQPIHWILDWDGTMTKKDTLDTLVSISASNKPDFPTQYHWQRVSKAYMDDYTSTLQDLALNDNLPKTIEDEKALLQKLKAVEQRSLDRVGESGIFSGLTKKALEEGVQKAIDEKDVELRNGFTEFHHAVQSEDLTLLSVNWSRHFISSCLSASGISIPEESILSNELSNLASGHASTGYIMSADLTSAPDGTIVSSSDKLQHLEDLRKKNMRTKMLVYVGDSWTDIECLVAVDLGICIRDEEMGSSQRQLAEALTRLEVNCVRLSEWKKEEGGVAWVRDFAEIQHWMESRLW
jgi:2-hydroxy-3-keto-5-methylthiopentenyl-1-phosphate phosphatase